MQTSARRIATSKQQAASAKEQTVAAQHTQQLSIPKESWKTSGYPDHRVLLCNVITEYIRNNYPNNDIIFIYLDMLLAVSGSYYLIRNGKTTRARSPSTFGS